jgi:hypothetical protein
MFNKKYIITRSSLKESLDYIEIFIEKFEKFQQKHSGYNYDIKLNHVNNKEWQIKVVIKDEEK